MEIAGMPKNVNQAAVVCQVAGILSLLLTAAVPFLVMKDPGYSLLIYQVKAFSAVAMGFVAVIAGLVAFLQPPAERSAGKRRAAGGMIMGLAAIAIFWIELAILAFITTMPD